VADIRLLVCGGRDFADIGRLDHVLSAYYGHIVLLIHGGARGADNLAGAWAMARKIPVRVYPVNWKKYGRSAGPIRNQQMLEDARPDLVIAFPGRKGTADMVRRALIAGVPVIQG
jgi:hypothetical protein